MSRDTRPVQPLRVVFMGTPSFALPAFEAIATSETLVSVVTQPDRPQGRGEILTASPIKHAAARRHIPVLQPEAIKNNPKTLRQLQALSPDIMVVVSFGQILPHAILSIPPLGCINLHPSLLPKYRGAAPIQRALIHGEQMTGISIMQMDVGMDTGPILKQINFPIDWADTAQTLSSRLADAGATLLMETINEIKLGETRPTPQNNATATYAPPLKKSEGRICWNESSEAIYNRWRGVSPWPGTTTMYEGSLLKIGGLEIGSPHGNYGKQGEMICANRDGLQVASGFGYVKITRLQLPGRREMSVAEFLSGHSIPQGTVFV